MIDPMLLHHAEEDFVLDNSWVLELKYDGVRAILDTTGDVDILYTRRGHEIHEQFPEISAPKGLILDGEIVGFDGDFHKLNWVQRRLGVVDKQKIQDRMVKFPVTYVAFDILGICRHDDCPTPPPESLMGKEWWERKNELAKFHKELTISPTFAPENIDKMWDYVRKNNLEGLVAKRTDSKYVQGVRTYSWRKIKHDKPTYRST